MYCTLNSARTQQFKLDQVLSAILYTFVTYSSVSFEQSGFLNQQTLIQSKMATMPEERSISKPICAKRGEKQPIQHSFYSKLQPLSCAVNIILERVQVLAEIQTKDLLNISQTLLFVDASLEGLYTMCFCLHGHLTSSCSTYSASANCIAPSFINKLTLNEIFSKR